MGKKAKRFKGYVLELKEDGLIYVYHNGYFLKRFQSELEAKEAISESLKRWHKYFDPDTGRKKVGGL